MRHDRFGGYFIVYYFIIIIFVNRKNVSLIKRKCHVIVYKCCVGPGLDTVREEVI